MAKRSPNVSSESRVPVPVLDAQVQHLHVGKQVLHDVDLGGAISHGDRVSQKVPFDLPGGGRSMVHTSATMHNGECITYENHGALNAHNTFNFQPLG